MSNTITMPENVRIFEDGAFIRLDGPMAAGWYKCKDLKEILPFFPAYKGELDNDMLKWIANKIPDRHTIEFAGLCKEYPKHEVKALLYYSPKHDDWHMYIPEQKGSGGSVTYDGSDYDPPTSYYLMGSIHTHPEMGAFWSVTDRNDIKDKDGVHIVFALRNGKYHDYECALFKNGFEYPQKELITLPAEGTELPEPSEEVKSRIKIPSYSNFIQTADNKHVTVDTGDYFDTWFRNNRTQASDSYLKEYNFMDESDSSSESVSDEILYSYADSVIASMSETEAIRFSAAILSLMGKQDLADYVESHLQADTILEEEAFEECYENVNTEFIEEEEHGNNIAH